MPTLTQVKEAATIFLVAALSFAAIEGGLLLRQSRKDEVVLTRQASQVLSETSATEVDLRRTILIASGAVNDIRHIAETERDQSKQQALLVNKSIGKLDAVLDSLNGAIQNQNLQLTALETQASFSMSESEQELNQTFTTLQPAIQAIADQTPVIAQNMADTSEQVKESSQNITATSADIHAYVHRMTAPVRGTWNFIKTLLGPAANVRMIASP